eukprot:scaffold8958_cov106-Phaeocystis_antarctica.AAC.1
MTLGVAFVDGTAMCLGIDNKAAAYVSHAFNAKKTSYTSLQWQDMAAQRAAWLKKTRPHDAITFVHKCSNVSDLLTKDCEPATKQAILSMVKAPPTTIGMYFGESVGRANLLYALWAPVMYLSRDTR